MAKKVVAKKAVSKKPTTTQAAFKIGTGRKTEITRRERPVISGVPSRHGGGILAHVIADRFEDQKLQKDADDLSVYHQVTCTLDAGPGKNREAPKGSPETHVVDGRRYK